MSITPTEKTSLLFTSGSPDDKKDQNQKTCSSFKAYFLQFFPCIKWIPQYNLKWFQCDVIAGLTVGLTVIPQALAYAQIAGLPVQYGLYSAFMGCFIYAIFGTSKDITLGPTAVMSLLVRTYGDEDPVQAVLLTLLSGCIQVAMGICKLGFIMRYISVPVVSGFTSAAAITIALGQLKHIFGVKTSSTDFFPELVQTFKHLSNFNPYDFVLGIISIFILLSLKFMARSIEEVETDESTTRLQKISRKFLWLVSLCRNAIVVLASAAIAYSVHTTNEKNCKVDDCFTVTGNIIKGLPPFSPPKTFEVFGNQTITGSQLVSRISEGLIVVPLMGILESLSIGKAFARKNLYEIDVSQEMFAIGLSNIMSSFVSSYSITGSFSRTAINSQSNVKSPAGGIVTGLLVIFGLVVLTPLIYYIPKSALGSVIISAVIFMVDLKTIKVLWKTKKIELIPLFVTFGVCLWQIPYGILAGTACSLLILLYPVTFPKLSHSYISSISQSEKSVLIVKINGALNYPGADYIQSEIKKLLKEGDINCLILNMQELEEWDFTGVLMLVELSQLDDAISLQLVNTDVSLAKAFDNHHQLNQIQIFSNLEDALAARK